MNLNDSPHLSSPTTADPARSDAAWLALVANATPFGIADAAALQIREPGGNELAVWSERDPAG